jgi:hypothetical protein
MDWKWVDERLIRRGELLLSLDLPKGHDLELGVMKDVSHPRSGIIMKFRVLTHKRA